MNMPNKKKTYELDEVGEHDAGDNLREPRGRGGDE